MKIWTTLALAAMTATLAAHDPGLSTASVRLETGRIVVELAFATEDLAALDANAAAAALAARAVEWKTADGAMTPSATSVEVQPRDVLFRYVLPEASAQFHSRLLAELPYGHRQWFTLRAADGTLLASQMLGAKSAPPSILIEPPATRESTAPATVGAFFVLGIEHILTGYDHLLFLLSLLIVCTRLWPAAQLITSFTVAHSLTLAAAAFGWLRLPGSIVEPVIAATIVYVAIENLFAQRSVRWRCAITFVFGLVHGLGFGGVLQELGVGQERMLLPLLGFNLGVEAGQLALAALLLPLWLRWRPAPRFLPQTIRAVSLGVAATGIFWLLQRTVLATG